MSVVFVFVESEWWMNGCWSDDDFAIGVYFANSVWLRNGNEKWEIFLYSTSAGRQWFPMLTYSSKCEQLARRSFFAHPFVRWSSSVLASGAMLHIHIPRHRCWATVSRLSMALASMRKAAIRLRSAYTLDLISINDAGSHWLRLPGEEEQFFSVFINTYDLSASQMPITGYLSLEGEIRNPDRSPKRHPIIIIPISLPFNKLKWHEDT